MNIQKSGSSGSEQKQVTGTVFWGALLGIIAGFAALGILTFIEGLVDTRGWNMSMYVAYIGGGLFGPFILVMASRRFSLGWSSLKG